VGSSLGRWTVGVLATAVVLVVIVVVAQRTGGDESGTGAASAPTARAVAVKQLRPMPRDAKADRPAIYDDGAGCQVENGDPVPQVCTSGDETADRTLMLVGDSKIAQWETAYSDLGRAGGWRVLTVTKSGCPFADTTLTSDREPRTDCRAWGRSALREVIAAAPDVVVTSQRASTGLLEGRNRRTRGAMIRGLQSYWRQLQGAGIQVVVQLDNPFPTTHPVYECVEDHPDDVDRCSFDLAAGVEESSAPMLRAAAESMPGVRILDLTTAICPDGERCPAVIGDVLVYRAGSHLTRTFTVSTEPQLAAALSRATDGRFGTMSP
jgi:hypothetical protein